MEHRAPLWTLVGIFVVFKLATTAMIILAEPDGVGTTAAVFLVFHWPMILVGLVAAGVFLTLSVMFRVRLRRVRARRQELEAAEWNVEQHA
jgi:hypothetical protein